MDRYYDTYLPFLLEACNDENPDVRQVCPNYDLVVALDWLYSHPFMVVFRQLYTGLVFVQNLVALCLNI